MVTQTITVDGCTTTSRPKSLAQARKWIDNLEAHWRTSPQAIRVMRPSVDHLEVFFSTNLATSSTGTIIVLNVIAPDK